MIGSNTDDPPASSSESADTTSGTTPGTQRAFLSTTRANEFFEALTDELNQREQRGLRLQENLIRQINEPLTSLTASVRELITMLRPTSNPGSPTPSERPRETSQQSRPTLTASRDVPSSPLHPFRASTTPPVREMTAFSSVTSAGDSQTTQTTQGTRLPGVKPPRFHGKDGENVLSWLHKIEQMFLLNSIPDIHKVASVSPLLTGDADSFYHYLVVRNKGVDPSWQEFRHALIAKYENPAV